MQRPIDILIRRALENSNKERLEFLLSLKTKTKNTVNKHKLEMERLTRLVERKQITNKQALKLFEEYLAISFGHKVVA